MSKKQQAKGPWNNKDNIGIKITPTKAREQDNSVDKFEKDIHIAIQKRNIEKRWNIDNSGDGAIKWFLIEQLQEKIYFEVYEFQTRLLRITSGWLKEWIVPTPSRISNRKHIEHVLSNNGPTFLED